MTTPQVAVGDALPELSIPIDRSTIVAAAIASQDFEDVHHDPGAAQGRGTPDIFMSINSTNGFLNRYVTDWSGPGSRIAKAALRLGVPLFPGDTLVFSGEVVGRNDRGPHVTATVTVVTQSAS